MQQLRPYSAAQSINVFQSGYGLGQQIKRDRDQTNIANAFTNGGPAQASQVANQAGRFDLAEQFRQFEARASEQEKQQLRQEIAEASQVTQAALRVPPEQRGQFLQQQLSARGLEDLIPTVGGLDEEGLAAFSRSVLSVQQQIQADLSNQRLTAGPETPSRIREVETLMRNYGMTQEQAAAAVYSGAQVSEFGGAIRDKATGQVVVGASDIGQARGVQQAVSDNITEGAARDREQQAQQPQAQRSLQGRFDRMQLVSDTIDRAMEQSRGGNTGPIAGRNPLATNLEATLSTIEANLGFDELQRMRDNSPTGGALGQVTEREIAYLQSVLGNLSRTQTEEQLDANLLTAKQQIQLSFQRIADAYQQDYGVPWDGGSGPAAPGAPQLPPGFELDGQ